MKKLGEVLFIVLLISVNFSFYARAEKNEDEREWGELESYDFSGAESFLKEQDIGEEGLSFGEIMKMLLNGQGKESLFLTAQTVKKSFISQAGSSRTLLLQIVLLGLAGAVFTNFSGIFTASQVSETGFLVTYILIFSCLAVSFFTSITVAEETMEKILEFLKLLMPSYFMAVAVSGGSASSAAFYETMFFTFSAVEWLFTRIMLPLIKISLLLSLASHIAKENMLSRLTELIKSGVGWGMKTVMGLVLGLNLLQGMIMPYVDAVKNSTVEKAIEAIPGVGRGAGLAVQLMLGSGILIKNTIGAAAAIVILMLAAVPVVRLAVLSLLYHCAAAALEPVCDKRIIACIGAAAEGYKILVKLLSSSVLLFILVIAIVCSATNAVYFSG